MHYDEAQFRILDAELITSLHSLGAKDNEVRLVHALPARLDLKPGTQGILGRVEGDKDDIKLRAHAERVPGIDDNRALFAHHEAVLRQLRKAYLRACEQIRKDPLSSTMGLIEEMLNTIQLNLDNSVAKTRDNPNELRFVSAGKGASTALEYDGERRDISKELPDSENERNFPWQYTGTEGHKVTIYLTKKVNTEPPRLAGSQLSLIHISEPTRPY